MTFYVDSAGNTSPTLATVSGEAKAVGAEAHETPSAAIWAAIDAGLKRHASEDDMRRAAVELGRL